MTTKTRKDSLSRKLRPRRVYRMQVAEPTAAQLAALADARQTLRMALVTSDRAGQVKAEKAEKAARASLDTCVQEIVLHNVAPPRLAALIDEHPPSKEQQAEGAAWNPDTFEPALIAESAQELGLTAEQWAAELASDRWSLEERTEMFSLALEVNVGNARRSVPDWL
jgi:hypothetical protein